MNPTPENNPKALPSVGHYELIECIGRGGMGPTIRLFQASYQAQQRRLATARRP
jgi:hypothetical protein